MKPNHLSTVALLAFLAGGCANLPSVGPDYHAPATKTPAHWSEPLAGGETNSAAATAAWWKNFHDTELDSLIARAACSNLDLRIAQARVREARAHYRMTSADFWPTVDGAGSYARQRAVENQPVLGSLPMPPGVPFENDVYQAGFDASWEIDVFGGKRRATESAKAQVAAAQFGEREVLVTLLGEVARNYVEARGYQRRLEIARDNIRAQEQSLAIVQNRFTNGLTSDLDVQQASTVLATTRAVVPALETALACLDSPARRAARTNARSAGNRIVSRRAHSRRAAGRARGPAFGIVVAPARRGAGGTPTGRRDREHRRGQSRICSRNFISRASPGSEGISADDWFTVRQPVLVGWAERAVENF